MSLKQSPLAQDAFTGKRVTAPWLAYLITVLCIFLVQVGGLAALTAVFDPKDGSAEGQWVELGSDLLMAGAVFLWVWLYERRSIKTLGFRKPGTGVVKLLVGILVGAALISAPIMFLWAIGAYEVVDGPDDAFTGLPSLTLVVALVAASIVQGGSEEVLIRGFLTQNNAVRFPAWLAILLPALLFTVLHGIWPWRPLPFIVIFGYAVSAALIMFWQNSLWLIIGIHAGWNWVMGNVWGIEVSGIDAKSTSLMYLSPTDGAPTWLTGGDFGTEASLPAAVMVIALTGISFLLFRRASRTWPNTATTALATDKAPATA
ncbi:CPBP family intramembrane glutamic endopeptidase [Microbacterium ureisolvens]|uniref:CPBP family intramembrane metalloprotease n=1 Tax=Microbacterium ureisolvens TaxID=2781186 RepID=A0ABS7HXP0_9MICO|nr:type II CAAX endopeptidase family protein [Microbacterium ureisolvens]MBW9110003.1 CPBP family intramembrane metalloprotease [Microbacterium ureisolvens]